MIALDELKSSLWGAAVLLRGKINATGYKEYIFPLVFFKRISDVHEEEYKKALPRSVLRSLTAAPSGPLPV